LTDTNSRMTDPDERPWPVDQQAIRKHNLALIVRLIRERGPMSRTDLAAATGLNKVTISSLVTDLMERALVSEAGQRATGASGRPARLLELGRHVAVAAAEVNVEHISLYATTLSGAELAARTVPLGTRPPSPDLVVHELAELLHELERVLRRRKARLGAVAVGIPGVLDREAGIARQATQLGWHDVSLVHMLREALGRPGYSLSVDRLANLAIHAERQYGPFRNARSVVLLYGDIGVGCATLVDGHVLRGAAGQAGECGHLPLDPRGPVCDCGRRGCLEAFVGLGPLLRAAVGGSRAAAPLHGRSPSKDSLERLAARAQAGDRALRRELGRQGIWLARGAAAVIHLLNPEAIVLGGYLARLAPFLSETFHAELRERLMPVQLAACKVGVSTLGTAAVLRGGAALAADELLADPARVPPAGARGSGSSRRADVVGLVT
jgi:predicted NBD/HSP70 family sugar kinase